MAPYGASVNAKAAVVTMAHLGSLMVEVDIAESSLEKVKIGAPAEIRLDAFAEERFPGSVHMLMPTADRSKATVLAKVKFDRLHEKILPEMSAKVAFLSRPLMEGEEKPFLGIPASALRNSPKGEHVLLVHDGRIHETPVITGRRLGESVEIFSGLKAGDIVALEPNESLKDGWRVKIRE